MDDHANCPVEATLQVIGGKWKCVILWRLLEGPVRFAQLRSQIAHITEKMLIQQLRELEADGVVHRQVYPQVPPKVEYSLTPYGKTLLPVLESLCKWGKAHLKAKAGRLQPA